MPFMGRASKKQFDLCEAMARAGRAENDNGPLERAGVASPVTTEQPTDRQLELEFERRIRDQGSYSDVAAGR